MVKLASRPEVLLPVSAGGELPAWDLAALVKAPPAFDAVDVADGITNRLERLETLVHLVTSHDGPLTNREIVADLMLGEIRALQVLGSRAWQLMERTR